MGDKEGTSKVNARPVFERLGQKKSSSTFYLESLSNKKSKTSDSSVFTRLSEEAQQQREGLRKDQDRSPVRVEVRQEQRPVSKPDHSGRSLDEDLRISIHQEKMAGKMTTVPRASSIEQEQRPRDGNRPSAVTSNARERVPLCKGSAISSVKRLGRRDVGGADIFKRLD